MSVMLETPDNVILTVTACPGCAEVFPTIRVACVDCTTGAMVMLKDRTASGVTPLLAVIENVKVP
jgi:hypothetical protein